MNICFTYDSNINIQHALAILKMKTKIYERQQLHKYGNIANNARRYIQKTTVAIATKTMWDM